MERWQIGKGVGGLELPHVVYIAGRTALLIEQILAKCEAIFINLTDVWACAKFFSTLGTFKRQDGNEEIVLQCVRHVGDEKGTRLENLTESLEIYTKMAKAHLSEEERKREKPKARTNTSPFKRLMKAKMNKALQQLYDAEENSSSEDEEADDDRPLICKGSFRIVKAYKKVSV